MCEPSTHLQTAQHQTYSKPNQSHHLSSQKTVHFLTLHYPKHQINNHIFSPFLFSSAWLKIQGLYYICHQPWTKQHFIHVRHWLSALANVGEICHHLIHPTQQQSPITDIVNASVLIHPQKPTWLPPKAWTDSSTQDEHSTNLAQSISKLCCLLGNNLVHWHQKNYYET